MGHIAIRMPPLGALSSRPDLMRIRYFPRSQFAMCWFGVALETGSLFRPDIELVPCPRNACAAGLVEIFGPGLAVIFENHPDIGQITGRRVRICLRAPPCTLCPARTHR